VHPVIGKGGLSPVPVSTNRHEVTVQQLNKGFIKVDSKDADLTLFPDLSAVFLR
jgi:chorismate-pyruvate lyase